MSLDLADVVNIGSGNGLVLPGNTPLAELIRPICILPYGIAKPKLPIIYPLSNIFLLL